MVSRGVFAEIIILMLRTKNIFIIAAATAAIIGIALFVSIRLKTVGTTLSSPPSANSQPKPKAATETGALPVLADAMPEFTGIASWLNSSALTPASLKGKIVLIDFWTYTCINCIRTLPYVTSWDEKYRDKGFVVIGVHTPEFQFEKDAANVRAAIVRYGIRYPVPLDNDYGTWNAYGNSYWPAEYLFDAEGRLRYTHFGEGEYDRTEQAIQSLLAEEGQRADMALTKDGTVDFSQLASPETYLGYGRMQSFGSVEAAAHDQPRNYSLPNDLSLNVFALGGRWTIGAESIHLEKAPGEIVYRYSASAVNLVLAPPHGKSIRAEVTLDGAPVPDGFMGSDMTHVNGKTVVRIDGDRLYNLIDAKGKYGEHTVRILFLDPGVDAFAFTFG